MHQVNFINNEDFEGKHNFLGNLLLMPGVNFCDANRSQMFSSHIEQNIQITKPQPPLWYGGFENQFGEYSSGYKKLEGSWRVLSKIKKNQYNYALILKKTGLSKKEKKKLKEGKKLEYPVGIFHVVFRTECENLTEKYGYRNKNEFIDSLEKGDIIEDEILFKDYNRDEENNFQYGRNLNAVYLSYEGLTTEDACIINESTAKNMSSYFVKKITVTLNTNDILINMYGNKNFYKCFPDIGEETKYGLLCGSRRIQYDTAPIFLSNMRKVLSTDTTYKTHGKVVDVKVISNIDDESILEKEYNKQIYHYYKQEQNYYRNFVNYLTKIVETKENKLSDDLIHYYNRFKMLSDPNIKFRVDNNLFDHLILEFTVLVEEPLVVGSKLTGRYGNKGVVSQILPDDEMPKIVNFAGYGPIDDDSMVNMKIDIILNPLGIPNRINIAQSLEQEFNYTSKIIRYEMEQNWNEMSLEELKNFVLDYIKEVNKGQYKLMKSYMDSLEDERLEDLLLDFIKDGIPLNQTPFWNNQNIHDLARVYEYTQAEKTILKDIENPVVFGEEYFMALKHLPSSKFSARSVDQLSIKNLPVKSNTYKMYKTNYSTNPIKLGEMEVSGLSAANPANKGGIKKVKNVLDAYANNETDRMRLLEAQLTGNPFEFDFELSDTTSVNIKIIKSFLTCLQHKLIDNEEEN